MIGIRVDANEIIATGHLIRCMSIAFACKKKGMEVIFILAEEKETERLLAVGFNYVVLNTDYRDMKSEKKKMKEIIKKYHIDWLIVDSYQADNEYLSEMNSIAKVMYIDDYGREKYNVSAILNYVCLHRKKEVKEMYHGEKTKLLIGEEFVPLRQNFCISAEEKRMAKKEKSILVTTGGTDTYNIAGKILSECVKNSFFSDYNFQVICGNMNKNEKYLRAFEEKYNNIKVYKNVSNIDEYMKQSLIAISAGGTTLFELSVLAIPVICFSFADNQVDFSKAISEYAKMYYAGDARNDKNIEKKILDRAKYLLENDKIREEIINYMIELKIGFGTERISEIFC